MLKRLLLTLVIFSLSLTSLVYTKPDGFIKCPTPRSSTICEHIDPLEEDFYIFPTFWPSSMIITMFNLPVLFIFTTLGKTLDLWYEYPWTPQPGAERTAVLSWFGWATLFLILFIYSYAVSCLIIFIFTKLKVLFHHKKSRF
jgi:hypothetical protein